MKMKKDRRLDDRPRYFAYIYVDLLTHKPFYAGKGCGNRHLSHLKSNKTEEILIKHIQSIGTSNISVIKVIDEVDEELALFVEEELITKYGRMDLGTGSLLNKTSGGCGCNLIRTEVHCGNISKTLSGKKKMEDHVNKVNKNPDKIKKTADKHRGMKRSISTRQKISDKAIGRPSYNLGLNDFYDPLTGHTITTSAAPLGYIKGNAKLKGKAGAAGKKWWYDPLTDENKCFAPGTEPANWLLGKLSAKVKRGPRK
ncbi:hypothetical protein [Acinetobacter sp.]|uniref:hypothetical protein n=1 Tax=Acinetobacter sp. TaxID=472 RepID=UPI003890DC29